MHLALAVGLALILALADPARAQGDPVCPAQALARTTTPTPPDRQLSRDNARKVAERAPREAAVLMLGDSMIERWDTAALSAGLGGAVVAKLGVGGDRTEHVLWRLQQLDSARFAPRVVVLMLGTNNLSAKDPVCAIAAGLALVAERVQAAWPEARLVVIETPPRGAQFRDKMPDRLQIYREMQARLRFGVTYLNRDADLVCGFAPFPAGWRAGQPSPCATIAEDLLHLTPAGYQVLDAALLAEIGPDLRAAAMAGMARAGTQKAGAP